eukprot:3047049-Amphidinium_carterae.2
METSFEELHILDWTSSTGCWRNDLNLSVLRLERRPSPRTSRSRRPNLRVSTRQSHDGRSMIKERAHDQGGVQQSPSGHAWLLMQSLGIPAPAWIPLLQRYNGVLPTSNQELEEQLTLIHRQGHVGEKGGLQDVLNKRIRGY